MTQSYKTIETSFNVWFAIMKTHSDDHLCLYATATIPGRAYTAWGLKNSTIPLIEAISTWDPEDHKDEIHKYFLCYPIEDNDS
jgi:hypothetical protein